MLQGTLTIKGEKLRLAQYHLTPLASWFDPSRSERGWGIYWDSADGRREVAETMIEEMTMEAAIRVKDRV